MGFGLAVFCFASVHRLDVSFQESHCIIVVADRRVPSHTTLFPQPTYNVQIPENAALQRTSGFSQSAPEPLEYPALHRLELLVLRTEDQPRRETTTFRLLPVWRNFTIPSLHES